MEIANWLLDNWINAFVSINAWQSAIAFFALWILLWLPIAMPLARAIAWRPGQPFSPTQKIAFVVSLYLVALPVLWLGIQGSGASWASFGLAVRRDFFLGGALGLSLALLGLALIFGAESVLGWLTWQPQNLPRLLPIALPILALALWISWTEEAIFRGVLLNWFAADLGWLAATAIASLIFALSHLIWEQQNTLPQLPGLVLMGAVLALARWLAGGDLGLAWGLHAGWIWGLTSLDSAELLRYSGRAAPWLTGLGGQPLAGVAGVLCLLLTAAALLMIGPGALGFV